jgi:hypothetical protein
LTETKNIQFGSGLAPHPYRMQLWGVPGNLSFPDLCANCGNSAHHRLTYSKFFYRAYSTNTTRSPDSTLIRVPFCDVCIAKHRAEGPGPSQLMNLLSRLLTLGQGLAALAFGLAATVAAYFSFIQFQRHHTTYFVSLGVLALFSAVMSKGMFGLMRDGTELIRAEKQSGMTLAFDFSDRIASPFESVRFDCTMRDEKFAKAFRELNQAIEYIPGNPVAIADQHNARKKFWKIAFVVAVIAIYGIVKELYE